MCVYINTYMSTLLHCRSSTKCNSGNIHLVTVQIIAPQHRPAGALAQREDRKWSSIALVRSWTSSQPLTKIRANEPLLKPCANSTSPAPEFKFWTLGKHVLDCLKFKDLLNSASRQALDRTLVKKTASGTLPKLSRKYVYVYPSNLSPCIYVS